jgi:hypothetical protein
MINEPFGGRRMTRGFTQGSERQVAVQAVADGPADDAAGKEVDCHGQVEPSFARPDV